VNVEKYVNEAKFETSTENASERNTNYIFINRNYICCRRCVLSIKNDFVAQLHKFMASLTDTRWKMDGKTVLYIPHEGTVVPVSPTTAKNKELIHRLESTTSRISVDHCNDLLV